MAKDVGTSIRWEVQIDPLGKKSIIGDTLDDVIQTVAAMSPNATITEVNRREEVFGDKKALK
jgi:hypothetical protein